MLSKAKKFKERPADRKSLQQTQGRTITMKYIRADLHGPRRANLDPDGLTAKVWRECYTVAWLHRTGVSRIGSVTVESEDEQEDGEADASGMEIGASAGAKEIETGTSETLTRPRRRRETETSASESPTRPRQRKDMEDLKWRREQPRGGKSG